MTGRLTAVLLRILPWQRAFHVLCFSFNFAARTCVRTMPSHFPTVHCKPAVERAHNTHAHMPVRFPQDVCALLQVKGSVTAGPRTRVRVRGHHVRPTGWVLRGRPWVHDHHRVGRWDERQWRSSILGSTVRAGLCVRGLRVVLRWHLLWGVHGARHSWSGHGHAHRHRHWHWPRHCARGRRRGHEVLGAKLLGRGTQLALLGFSLLCLGLLCGGSSSGGSGN